MHGRGAQLSLFKRVYTIGLKQLNHFNRVLAVVLSLLGFRQCLKTALDFPQIRKQHHLKDHRRANKSKVSSVLSYLPIIYFWIHLFIYLFFSTNAVNVSAASSTDVAHIILPHPILECAWPPPKYYSIHTATIFCMVMQVTSFCSVLFQLKSTYLCFHKTVKAWQQLLSLWSHDQDREVSIHKQTDPVCDLQLRRAQGKIDRGYNSYRVPHCKSDFKFLDFPMTLFLKYKISINITIIKQWTRGAVLYPGYSQAEGYCNGS